MKLYNELAEYYFAIEDVSRDLQEEVSFIKSLLPKNLISNILDLGCGSGEHLGLLSKDGFNCVGLDNSKKMLEIAKARNGRNVKYLQASMKKFDFYEEYNLVISLFGSFNYLIENSEIEDTLWNIWRSLKQDGLALLEIWNAEPLHEIKEKRLEKVSSILFKGTRIERDRGFKLLKNKEKTVVEVLYNYVISKNKIVKLADRHVMRAFYKKEIEKFFAENGFSIIDCFSNIKKDPFHKYSNKMIYILQKK